MSHNHNHAYRAHVTNPTHRTKNEKTWRNGRRNQDMQGKPKKAQALKTLRQGIDQAHTAHVDRADDEGCILYTQFHSSLLHISGQTLEPIERLRGKSLPTNTANESFRSTVNRPRRLLLRWGQTMVVHQSSRFTRTGFHPVSTPYKQRIPQGLHQTNMASRTPPVLRSRAKQFE